MFSFPKKIINSLIVFMCRKYSALFYNYNAISLHETHYDQMRQLTVFSTSSGATKVHHWAFDSAQSIGSAMCKSFNSVIQCFG